MQVRDAMTAPVVTVEPALPELSGRRVLVEVGNPAAARRLGRVLTAAGFEAAICDGRGAGGRGCPLLRGLPCAELEAASAVLCGLGPGPITEAVLETAGERAEPFDAGAEEAGLAAVRRVRARRARRVRRLLETGGRRLLIRAIDTDDTDRIRRFDDGLSDRTRRLRYLSYMPPLSTEQAERMADVDFQSRFAFVAVEGRGADRRVVADARLLGDADHPGRAELAVAVADDLQGRGIGPLLLQLLIDVAGERGFDQVGAEVWWDNQPIIRVLRRLGFERTGWELGVMTFVRTAPS